MGLLKIEKNEIQVAADLINSGKIVAFPTETVYGLGVVFDNQKAFNDLVIAKKRPENKPFSLMCDSISSASEIAIISKEARIVMEKYLPGPLTMLLQPKIKLPDYVTMKLPTVGIRIPNHKVALELIKLVGKPLLVPSANIAGETPATTSDEVIKVFNNSPVAGVILGTSDSEVPSTIVDFTCNPVKLIREGAILFKDILKTLEEIK